MKTRKCQRQGSIAPAAWVLSASLLAAVPTQAAAQTATTGRSAVQVTFARDVAPLFQQKCEVCHRPGNIGPMPLTSYEEVRPWVRSIRARVASREMPPWHLDKTVGIQRFINDVSLSDAQIDTIVGWIDAGAPMGNPSDAPPPLTWPASGAWKAGTPDLVVAAPAVNVPASGPDEYPEVEMATGLTEDRYLQSIEVLPENDPVVHHVIVYTVEPGDNAERIDDGLRGATHLANLAKGGSPDTYREGTARLLRKGTKIRFQIHLHPNGRSAFVEHTKVGFRFFPKGYVPTHLVNTKTISSQATLVIPPMESNVRNDARFRLEHDATLVSFQPHMHYRGKRMMLEAELPSGETKLLSDIDRFTQGWQLTYQYKTPPRFPAGTVLHVIAFHDNSPANKLNPDPTAVVTWGERTVDEMAIGWLDYYYMTDAVPTQAAVGTAAAPVAPRR